ncbi:MAG: hypothetical protein QXG01_03355 [Candidatus Bathyarchaeia archaeon]
MVEKRYSNKRVNIEELRDALKKLFKENGYTVKDKDKDSFQVKSGLKKGWYNYNITVKGKPEDFKVSIISSNILKFMFMGLIGITFDNVAATRIMKAVDEVVEFFSKRDD